jgi:microsomal dipeptidase-like Zn-dependent dipeptidase
MPNLPIVDLHSHFPMHLGAVDRGDPPHTTLLQQLLEDAKDEGERLLFAVARTFLNDPTLGKGPAVNLARYREGRVAVACSVLYSPFDELNVDGFRRKPPSSQAFRSVMTQMEAVENELRGDPRGAIVRNAAELSTTRRAGKVALVHCIEGGFQLGATEPELAQNIRLLKQKGVIYVTVAHLLYRQLATCAPAFPFLPDALVHVLHPQPSIGLTTLGRCAVQLLMRNRILVDVTHMSERALEETLAIHASFDPARRRPLFASHMACRFGRLEYNLSDRHVAKIAATGGVLGVIACEHYAGEGLKPAHNFSESVLVIKSHIDRIHRVTGSYDHIAIGSDHDGFIKPTLPGLETPLGLAKLADALEVHYGTEVASKICHRNAERLLDAAWS